MSLANKKLTPIPVGDGSGKFWELKKQYGGMKQVVRRFKVEGGKFNIGDNVDTYVFDDYGTLDGFSTAPVEYVRSVPESERFANCYLETQEQDKGQGDGKETIVTKVYQEAYDTLREIEQPEEATDENGRKTLRRTYVILNTAPEANSDFDPATTLTPDVDNPDLYLFKQNKRIGNAVTVVQRDFIEAGNTLQESGDAILTTDENGRDTLQRTYIILSSAPVANSDFDPASALVADSEYTDLYLYRQTKQSNKVATIVTREFIEATDTPVQVGRDIVSWTESGLKTVEQSFIVQRGYALSDFGTVGITIGADGDVSGLYLSGLTNTTHNETVSVFVARWAEAGIVNAEKEFARDGLLYVTFSSQGTKFIPTALNSPTYNLTDSEELAFQGGLGASIFRSRTRNINGFRIFIVTVMMNQDGTPLDLVNDNEVNSYQKWAAYEKPGILTITLDNGPVAEPSVGRQVKVQITEYLTTDSTISDSFKPYSVTSWAYYNVSFTPEETGIAQTISKGASSYLADSSIAGNNTSFWGTPVSSVAGNAFSSPTPAVFNALSNQVIGSDNDPAFTTDEGVKWYKKVKMQVIGTFGTYL